MLGKLTGDQAAEAAHRGAFSLPLETNEIGLYARLRPDPTRQAQVAALKAGPDQGF
jgi:hypothetical protein